MDQRAPDDELITRWGYEKGYHRHREIKQYYQAAISMALTESESRNLAGQSFAARDLYYKAQREWKKVLEEDSTNEAAKYHLKWLESQVLDNKRIR